MTQSTPQLTPMHLALEQAQAAADRGEVPVGAVVMRDGEILASAGNRVIELRDPTAHAEILAIRAAAQKLSSERLMDCDIYVTLEPCAMCAQAIALARLRRLYYGADDPKGGAIAHGARIFAQPTCHHHPEIYDGVQAQAAARLLQDFFRSRR